jgi:hypothetical protein
MAKEKESKSTINANESEIAVISIGTVSELYYLPILKNINKK